MKNKVCCLFIATILITNVFCSLAFAHMTAWSFDDSNDLKDSNLSKVQFVGDKNVTGTVYVSLSDDGKYIKDNKESIMAYIPVKMSDLAEIDLEEYGYSDFVFDLQNYKDEFQGKQPITVFHLYLYLIDNYYGGDQDDALLVSGSAGSLYMSRFWGHDENLTYYINGEYPLDGEGWGATSDHIILEDGDFIDLSMFSDWSFYSDNNAGYHYFFDKKASTTGAEIIISKNVKAGESFSLYLGRAWGDLMSGGATTYKNVSNKKIYYSDKLYDTGNTLKEATTDSDGKVTISFDKSGEYYVWTDGGKSGDVVVSAPGLIKIIVESSSLLGDINGDGKIMADDAALCYSIANGKTAATEEQKKIADVNKDGEVRADDAALIYSYSNGKILSF